jgi:hypothetical protein
MVGALGVELEKQRLSKLLIHNKVG